MCNWITIENADVVVAWATVFGLVVAVAGAASAVWQLVQIRRDSRERTRPYVQLDVVPGIQGVGSWDLIIENTGASVALEVTIDAGELVPQSEGDHIVPNITEYLRAPKTLVPRARRRVMWAYDREDLKVCAGVLEPRIVKVAYLDDKKARSRWGRKHPYRGEFGVGDPLRGAAFPAPTEGAKPNSKDALQHIDRALRAMNTHIGELRR